MIPSSRIYPLADPDLGGPIDIILGNKSRRQCVTSQTIDHKELELGLTKTIFGWTVSGPLKTTEKPPAFLVQTRDEELDNAIQALWNADKVPEAPTMSPEDDQAVQHFRTTHQTAIDGKFIVKLPKKPDAPSLGASRQQAIKRFLANETSLRKKNKLEDSKQFFRNTLPWDMLNEFHHLNFHLLQSIIFRSREFSRTAPALLSVEQSLMPQPEPLLAAP